MFDQRHRTLQTAKKYATLHRRVACNDQLVILGQQVCHLLDLQTDRLAPAFHRPKCRELIDVHPQ